MMIEGNSVLPDPETLADQVLSVTGQRRPPTDVRSILGKWSKLSIVETDLDGDGFIVDLGEIGAEIFVKKSKQETRKRFTLAHELGHYLLQSHIRGEVKNDEVERWCNKFASGLLLPRLMLRTYLRTGGIQQLTEKLQKGPAIFQVSEQAFYMRISKLFPLSIIKVRLSKTELSIVHEYRSTELEEYLGPESQPWTKELETFLFDLADWGAKQQRELRK